MANESGNDEALERLSKLVDIDDPVTGRVRPKAKVENGRCHDARDQIDSDVAHLPSRWDREEAP